jgi:hypothetical protein
MGAESILAPEAERDIAEAYAWYEDRRPGLGEAFLIHTARALHKWRQRLA